MLHFLSFKISFLLLKRSNMGNKQLRPDPTDPFAPFGDDQKAYLK